MSNPVMDLKHELLAAAERQHQLSPAPVHALPSRRHARALAIAAAVTVAAAVVLFLTAPWSRSPDFLAPKPAQAARFLALTAAALTPPRGRILHAKLTQTTSCAVHWTADFWADEHTDTYRGVFHDPVLPYPFRYFTLRELQNGSCKGGSTYEMGVVLGPRNYLVWSEQQRAFVRYHHALRFVPPNKLYRYPVEAPLDLFGRVPALDPAAAVRNAIRTGRAHAQGRTKLSGRIVQRIRIDACPLRAAHCTGFLAEDGGYAYVDPKTYYPVEIRDSASTIRFSAYEYLPRTPANLALTNIRAQHPHARLTDH